MSEGHRPEDELVDLSRARPTASTGDRADPARSAIIDKAVVVVAGLVVLAFGVLLVDLVRQGNWLDVVLLLVGGALLAGCFVLQRWARPSTG